jgi:fructosamine-3-kinase
MCSLRCATGIIFLKIENNKLNMDQKFSNPKQDGLEKAYSSTLRMETRSHGRVVVKAVDARERKNEIYFHECMREAGLPSMKIKEEGEASVIDFVENAITLGDNETMDNYLALGNTVKIMHATTYDCPFYIDEKGQRVNMDWQDFIVERISCGRGRQRGDGSGFNPETITKIIEFIENAGIKSVKSSVLLHGDLHANNVLLKKTKVFLFDKADQIVAGDPLYDLSLISINLPGAIFGLGENTDQDTQLLEAFIKGYGTDFTVDETKLQAYVLLRSLERWPNPFEKEIPDIVKKILD